ncbi:sugar phosphate isomerase/epimerase family protein [Haloarchaeobius sp. TZWSO28]|uniref:sugar phosphate isomerase/epimerase family protein n=1 Tax=Haloarchaeobius sp. TZWSO28 TaxID=3446119 RepID=UPI003EC0034B
MKTALFTKVLGERSLTEVVDIAAEMGYDGVEPMGREPHLPPETPLDQVEHLRARLDEHGLDVPCFATYTGGYVDTTDEEREAALADLRHCLEIATTLDCGLVRHSVEGPPVRHAVESDFETAAAWFRRAADLADEYDIRLAVEIHAHKLTETTESTLKLLEMVDRDNVGAIHDAGNMFIVDAPYGPETVERLGDRLFHVHVKDERRVDDDSLPGTFELETRHGLELFQPRRLGDGDVDHRPLIAALADAGYDGSLTVECHVPTDDPDSDLDVARHELAVLREYLDDV